MGLTPETTYKPTPSIDSFGIYQKNPWKGPEQSDIGNQLLSAAISFAESKGIDADRVIDSFLEQFNALYYRFNFASLNVLSFLFKVHLRDF